MPQLGVVVEVIKTAAQRGGTQARVHIHCKARTHGER